LRPRLFHITSSRWVNPDIISIDAHIQTRLYRRREQFFHGCNVQPAADPDGGALTTDFGGKERRLNRFSGLYCRERNLASKAGVGYTYGDASGRWQF
jgi:hypothetical protein